MVDAHRTRDKFALWGTEIPFSVSPSPRCSHDGPRKLPCHKLLELLRCGEDAQDLKLFVLMAPQDVDAHLQRGWLMLSEASAHRAKVRSGRKTKMGSAITGYTSVISHVSVVPPARGAPIWGAATVPGQDSLPVSYKPAERPSCQKARRLCNWP